MNAPVIRSACNTHVLDASAQPVGRLASQIAILLQGKHKPVFAKHLTSTGDKVIVINAAKLQFTGRKMEDKRYYSHSGYPGGLKTRSVRDYLEVKKLPRFIIEHAVRGMLPKNRLQDVRMRMLEVFPGTEIPSTKTTSGNPNPTLSTWKRL